MIKSFLKSIVPEDSILYKINRKRFYYQKRILNYYKPWYPKLWESDILDLYNRSKKRINFIQIGSNDGVSGDPINKYIKDGNWYGVLVEPVPFLFKRLLHNYYGSHDKLQFENSAISNESGKVKFYRIETDRLDDYPDWFEQLGSFRKEVVQNNFWQHPELQHLLIEDYVNGITFIELLNKYSVSKLDLLHIDTEGYDGEIIKMIPFNNITIDVIMFEHVHLAEIDYKTTLKLLKSKGYKVGRRSNMDTIAIKKNILKTIQPNC